MKTTLIAACGMDCGICMAYLREKDRCLGCRAGKKDKPAYCVTCIIANCPELKRKKAKLCYLCQKYPCRRLKQLQKRYATKYNVDLFENFRMIKEKGVREFVRLEEKKWTCKKCGVVMSCHRPHVC